MVKRKSIIFIILFTILIMLGCTKVEKEIQYIEKPIYIEVPVLQKIEIEPIKKPLNYLKNITLNSTPKEVVEAYVNTIKQQNIYIKQLEKVIEQFYIKDR